MALEKSVKERNRGTYLNYLPSIDAKATESRSQGLGVPLTTKSRSAALEVSVNLFAFGADAAKVESAKAEQKAARADTLEAILEAEKEGVDSATNWIQSVEELSIAQKILGMRLEALNVAQKRYKKGLLPKQEVEKVKIDHANDEAAVNDLKRSLISSQATLEELLGRNDLRGAWPWKERFKGLKLKWSQSFIKFHPKLKAAKQRVQQSEGTIKESWRRMLPSIDASGSYGYQDINGFKGDVWQGGLTLTIPIFNKLTDYGNYRSKVQQKVVSQLSLEQVRRDLRSEWKSAKGFFEISLDSAQQREKTLVISRKLYQDNLRRFRKGLISANDLILDQSRLFQSEQNNTRGWKEVHTGFARICHAEGKRLRLCLAMLQNRGESNTNKLDPNGRQKK